MAPCCVSRISALFDLHISPINWASHLHPSTSESTLQIVHLSSATSHYFGSTMKATSFSPFVSLVVLFVSLLLPLVPLLSLSASFFIFVLLPSPSAAALFFLFWFQSIFFIFVSHAGWYVTLSTSAFTSRFFQSSSISNSSSLPLLRMHIGTSPSVCLWLCLPPPVPFTHSSSCSLCVVVSHLDYT